MSSSTRVRGCALKSGALKWNSDFSSTGDAGVTMTLVCTSDCPTTTTEPPPVYFEFSGSRFGQCEDAGDEYCPIRTVAGCEAAAAEVGLSDTTAGDAVSNLNKVRGCSLSDLGGLKWNAEFASTEDALSSMTLLCTTECSTTTVDPDATTGLDDYYAFTGLAQCEDAGTAFCAIPDVQRCEDGAAATGMIDTEAGLISATNKVKGCSVSGAGVLKYVSSVIRHRMDTVATAGAVYMRASGRGLQTITCCCGCVLRLHCACVPHGCC